MNFSIEPYETENGRKPVMEFLSSLDENHRAKLIKNLTQLRIKGNMLGLPLSKPLRDGIFELRTQSKGNISRVCYFFVYGRKIVSIQKGHRGRFKCGPNRDTWDCHQYVPVNMF